MIFEQDSVGFQILDVLFLEQGSIKLFNDNRNFDALSYRYRAETLVEAGEKTIAFSDHSIGYFPSDVNYMRTSKQDKMIVVHFKSFTYHSNDIEQVLPADYEKYESLFEEILRCWQQKQTAYKHEAAAILNRIFAELYRDNKPSDEYKSKIYPSFQYIKQNCLQKEFSLQKAAQASHISETYFRKLFHREYGMSPKQYVIKRRLQHAASLIIAGYYSLEEIAELCGYNDYKHFSVEFKKNVGVSPSKYMYNYTEE